MRILENLEPQNVFYFFEEICKIPHGSGNTEKISAYLENFAKERQLEHYRDEAGNIIMIKEAAAGYEDHAPVILQGHMDMVAVKEPDCEIDMKCEGLKLATTEDKIYAEGSSLGGDDGIAVAYGLALLDGNYRHPRIELVITVDEEVGMNGAEVLDVTPLKARQMINLDSEEEGVFWVGCAGGARVDLILDGKMTESCGLLCEVEVSGLLGGHSGAEIHKERGNGICLLGRCLHELSEKAEFCIKDLQAGVADNAIPIRAKAQILLTAYQDASGEFCLAEDDMEGEVLSLLKKQAAELTKELQEELADKDPQVKVEVHGLQREEAQVLSQEESRRVSAFIGALPYGVQAMSFAVPGLVETSLNPGLLSMEKGNVRIGISVRSSFDSAKKALIGRLKDMAYLAGARMEVSGNYPGWAYRKDSLLREKMVEVYTEIFGKKPSVEAVHAGLECGLFAYKIPGLDCVSIGPDMKNIHTTQEELSISSTARVWDYLLKLLERM